MSPRGISPSGPPPWPPPCSSPQPATPNSVAPAMPTPPAFRKSLRLNLLSAIEPPPFPSLSLLTLAPPFHFSWPLQLSFEVSQFAGEGRTEPRKSFGVVVRGIRLEPDRRRLAQHPVAVHLMPPVRDLDDSPGDWSAGDESSSIHPSTSLKPCR